LSLVGGMGMLAGAFTLGTHCVLQKWFGVMAFLQIGGDLFVRVSVLHQQCVVSPVRLEISLPCLSFLGWLDPFSQCMHYFVSVCDGWIGDAFVLKLDCVG
jgi:hypothetical protein